MENVGKRLKKLRVDGGYTGEELSKEFNKKFNSKLSRSLISRLENNTRPLSEKTRYYIANFLKFL